VAPNKAILRYSIACLCIALVIGFWKNGIHFLTDAEPENIIAAILFLPIVGTMFWLRWDWAPEQRRKAQAAKKETSQP
jgi:hypothetical protein